MTIKRPADAEADFRALVSDLPMRTCRECGCSEWDACVDDNGAPCHWIEEDLCSAHSPAPRLPDDPWTHPSGEIAPGLDLDVPVGILFGVLVLATCLILQVAMILGAPL